MKRKKSWIFQYLNNIRQLVMTLIHIYRAWQALSWINWIAKRIESPHMGRLCVHLTRFNFMFMKRGNWLFTYSSANFHCICLISLSRLANMISLKSFWDFQVTLTDMNHQIKCKQNVFLSRNWRKYLLFSFQLSCVDA